MSLDPWDIWAFLVTRGDVDMDPIIASLGMLGQVVVWDNSTGTDLMVWGRYVAMMNAPDGIVYTQDDDVILPPESLAALMHAYVPGKIVCNVPERFRERYTDSSLVGFGALLEPHLVSRAVSEYEAAGGSTTAPEFLRACDLVVTMLNDIVMVDVPYEELPYASDANRMWKQPYHVPERDAMRDFCRQIRSARAA